MTDGPESAGVAVINAHGVQDFGGVLKCSWDEEKGRIFRAARHLAAGEVIFVEGPLHVVHEDPKCNAFKKLKNLCMKYENDFPFDILWYWNALRSLTQEQLKGAKADGWTGVSLDVQQRLLLLQHDEVKAPSRASEIMSKSLVPEVDPMVIERLLSVWLLNCFECDDEGYAIYLYSSFMSHSCFPNAIWDIDGTDLVVRARREISRDEEVCIRYLVEDDLVQPVATRRRKLHNTKRFWCNCERCSVSTDPSRAFICPRCRIGTMFAHVDNASINVCSPDYCSRLIGATCAACGHDLAVSEREEIEALEDGVRMVISNFGKLLENDSFGNVSVEEIRSHEGLIDAHFVQHALADSAWKLLAAAYAAKACWSDQRRLLWRRCGFHAHAYPKGLSGEHAWAIEAYADSLVAWATRVSTVTPESSHEDCPFARGDQQTACRLYAEALSILTNMFGKEHGHCTTIQIKLTASQCAR